MLSRSAFQLTSYCAGSAGPWQLDESFNMAVLAMRGCTAVNGVSQLHGKVSRQIFQTLFPGGPA